uniref:Rab-GAP TBC domain-containing protein n=1 Tax=Trichobilharzia regenti TaxID=157069 RepID=A0AA85IZK8_TRIRE|nr:unnamed protein product [Trichobilharzia regenti]
MKKVEESFSNASAANSTSASISTPGKLSAYNRHFDGSGRGAGAGEQQLVWFANIRKPFLLNDYPQVTLAEKMKSRQCLNPMAATSGGGGTTIHEKIKEYEQILPNPTKDDMTETASTLMSNKPMVGFFTGYHHQHGRINQGNSRGFLKTIPRVKKSKQVLTHSVNFEKCIKSLLTGNFSSSSSPSSSSAAGSRFDNRIHQTQKFSIHHSGSSRKDTEVDHIGLSYSSLSIPSSFWLTTTTTTESDGTDTFESTTAGAEASKKSGHHHHHYHHHHHEKKPTDGFQNEVSDSGKPQGRNILVTNKIIPPPLPLGYSSHRSTSGSLHVTYPKELAANQFSLMDETEEKVKEYRLRGFSQPYIPDMHTCLPGIDVLKVKIRDYDLKLDAKVDNLARYRHAYKIGILNDKKLKNFFTIKRPDTLPDCLQRLVRLGSLSQLSAPREKEKNELEALQRERKYCRIVVKRTDTALDDVRELWLESRYIIHDQFSYWLSEGKPNEAYSHLSVMEAEEQIRHYTKLLKSSGLYPTSSIRHQWLNLLSTFIHHDHLLNTLMTTIDIWLNGLLEGLFNPERTVREETCYLLAYLFIESRLTHLLANYTSIDLCYDVTMTVLRAIELYPITFIHYYTLLALMIEGCPVLSILQAILDKCPYTKCILLQHYWPRLIYYILKFWPLKQFSNDRLELFEINDSLDKGYMNPISKVNSKLAQSELGKRFLFITKPMTVWLPQWLRPDG